MPNYYPVFLNLNKVPCLVVGGGEVAYRKTEALLPCGAEVTVISPELYPSLQQLQETKQVTWICKTYQAGDCQGFQMVISATDQEDTNALVTRECKAAGILVNVVDDPPKCSFFVPSVLRRGKLVIAVSTGGAPDSTGLNRCTKACRVPSSRKTIGNLKLPTTRSLHTLPN